MEDDKKKKKKKNNKKKNKQQPAKPKESAPLDVGASTADQHDDYVSTLGLEDSSQVTSAARPASNKADGHKDTASQLANDREQVCFLFTFICLHICSGGFLISQVFCRKI